MLIVENGPAVLSLARYAVHRDEAPLVGLGHPFAGRFHAWYGRARQRYVTSVFQIDPAAPAAGLPDLGAAVLIAVKRDGGGRTITGLVAIERLSDWARAVVSLYDEAASKPDEWHVHLIAPDRAARAAMIADLEADRRRAVVA